MKGNGDNMKKPKEIKECDCTQCKRNCKHRDSFRRLPKEIGGLGLCPNLNIEHDKKK